MCVVLVGAVLLCVALAVLAVLCGYCAPKCAGNCSPSQPVLMSRWRTPCAAKARMCHSSKGLPCTASSGLGVWSVSGRMRLPRPAASSMACAGGWGGWLIGMEARVASMMGWQVAVWRRFAGGLLGFAGYGVSQAVLGAVGNCRRLGFVCACAGCVGYVGCRQAVSCLLPLV